MASQLDLDQGGTTRQLQRIYLGPSVGWMTVPSPGVWGVTSAGPTTILLGTTLVTVNYNGSVALVLPKAAGSAAGAQALPGTYIIRPITIVDIGGFATIPQPITIAPGDGTIDGQANVAIRTPYGALILSPNTPNPGYTLI